MPVDDAFQENGGFRPVQGGEEDTEERVKVPHTEMKSEVTSLEERHDAQRMTARSDVTAVF